MIADTSKENVLKLLGKACRFDLASRYDCVLKRRFWEFTLILPYGDERAELDAVELADVLRALSLTGRGAPEEGQTYEQALETREERCATRKGSK